MDFNGQKAMELLNEFKEPNETYIEEAAPRLVEGIKRLKAFVSKYKWCDEFVISPEINLKR